MILTVIISFAMAVKVEYSLWVLGHLNIGQVKLEKGPRPTRWTKDAHIVHQDPNLVFIFNEDYGDVDHSDRDHDDLD